MVRCYAVAGYVEAVEVVVVIQLLVVPTLPLTAGLRTWAAPHDSAKIHGRNLKVSINFSDHSGESMFMTFKMN